MDEQNANPEQATHNFPPIEQLPPTSDKYISRQAVVVIHGMGEQRPMETLRSFVDGVHYKLKERELKDKIEALQELSKTSGQPIDLEKAKAEITNAERKERGPKTEHNSTVRSKPDSIGDIYETVRLCLDSTDTRPRTDFYEFYWAHNMRDTTFKHTYNWLVHVLSKRTSKLPKRLQPISLTLKWLIAIILLGIVVYTYFNRNNLGEVAKTGGFTAVGLLVLNFLLAFVPSFIKTAFLSSFGDVARYFTPHPDNIGERSRIRQQGIAFLKNLHALNGNPKVDRIIVVAHSLGSVVAYDLLRLLWTECNEVYQKDTLVNQKWIDIIDEYSADSAANLLTQSSKIPGIKEYQKYQFELWKEQRKAGNPWLITDFVTMGAAINAIDNFMVTTDNLNILKDQRELPTAPPIKDAVDKKIYYEAYKPHVIDGTEVKMKLLNHGALFAPTRWTNIYYTSDFVGGPIKRFFGDGVKDVSVVRKSPWFFPGGHTAYWEINDKQNIANEHEALDAIIDAMHLDCNKPIKSEEQHGSN